MKFREITLYSSKIEELGDFYGSLSARINILNKKELEVQVGWTTLKFLQSNRPHIYHYCFLAPNNKLEQALEWAKQHMEPIEIDKGRYIQPFQDWEAESFYFYDSAGNIVEISVRFELEHFSEKDFNFSDLLGVNEIGLPTHSIACLNTQLQEKTGSSLWKGNMERFATNGSPSGLILMPNPRLKPNWFPNGPRIEMEPLFLTAEVMGKLVQLEYSNGNIL